MAGKRMLCTMVWERSLIFQGRKGLQHQGERMEWPPAGGKQEQHEAPLVDYLPEEWKAA